MAARRKVSPTCRVFIQRHIRIHRREGMSRDQSVAVAYSEARERGCKVPPPPRRHPEGSAHEQSCHLCGGMHCECACPMME